MTVLRSVIWCAVSSRAQNEPDKVSLPQQEDDGRKLALSHDWRVVDVMRVPGHSRRYIDFHKLSADAAQQGIDAFHRLEKHWEARDFDVMIVLDGNRFARTQALHAYVVERTIHIGARIYSLMDGWIDKQNHRMWIAMNGYKSAGEIDRFVQARDRAMTARAERGLPITSRIPMSHQVVRDPKSGKALCLEVNEDKRRLWNDLAELVLEGVAWDRMEVELYERFGHANEEGEPYYANCMYRLLMKPVFWGHTARHHNSANSKNGFRFGRWIWDESAPIPEGSTMFRNTHEPVWAGELGDRIRHELDRRAVHIKGSARTAYTHRLSGLAICAECGSFMATRVDGSYLGLYCPASKGRPALPKCSHRRVVSERKIIARIDEFVKQMLREKTTDIFNSSQPETAHAQERIVLLDEEIAEVEDKIRALIRKQITAGDDIQYIYDEELDKLNVQLKAMKEARTRLQGESLAAQTTTSNQQVTLEELAKLTLEKFWHQESRKINQMLHRIMGKRRLVIRNGEIIGVAEVNRTQRRRY